MQVIYLSSSYVTALEAHGVSFDGVSGLVDVQDKLTPDDQYVVTAQTIKLLQLPYFAKLGLRPYGKDDDVFYHGDLNKVSVFSDEEEDTSWTSQDRVSHLTAFAAADGNLILCEKCAGETPTLDGMLCALGKILPPEQVMETSLWEAYSRKI